MHFSEIIKLQYGKKNANIALYFTVFRIIVPLLSLKKCVVTPNFLFGFQ